MHNFKDLHNLVKKAAGEEPVQKMCALKQNHREKSEVSLLQTIPMWLHRTNNNKRSSHVSPKSMEAKFEVPGMVFQQLAGNATHLILFASISGSCSPMSFSAESSPAASPAVQA